MKKYGKKIIDIPYSAKELTRIPYCYEDLPAENFKLTPDYDSLDARAKVIVDTAVLKHKNNYIMNNNGARNRALAEGIKMAEWIFPWDGNCFITDGAWENITQRIDRCSHLKYHIVPMERVQDNDALLVKNFKANPFEEPQVIFRRDAELRFDESLMYGLKPKIDLLKRLGVPGIWDKWKNLYPWKTHEVRFEPGAFSYCWTGWVARLFSGNLEQELSAHERAINREKGIVAFIRNEDRKELFSDFNKDSLAYYCEDTIISLRRGCGNDSLDDFSKSLSALEKNAEEFLAHPLYSVTEKTTVPPSGNIKDYWHPAPYAWPNPDTPDGLPYIHKDGLRVPGTRMYEAQSNKYDRTAIQRVFDETTALSLAGYVFSKPAYTEKAAKLIRRWFIDEKTAMNPHLTYSQVVMGKNQNRGTASGLIETKDMYFFLDAVRLVKKSHFWCEDDEKKILEWCKSFLAWLNNSDQGRQEVAANNNHGVAFDLQTYALAAFIGDVEQMYEILLRALSRMKGHVDKNGMQSHEMTRTTTAHYTAFNLHLWFNLSVLLRRTAGLNLFNEERDYDGVKFNPLKKAASWVLGRAAGDWPFKQIDEFDKERYQHLYHTVSRYSPAIREKFQGVIKSFSESKVVFFPHDGIAPFWTLQG
ncbi:alginate lyase family protein [Prosthecochloris sp. GSB1]|uniref:alginate lyase family protein n=1 Tax=Prosthecochloris sp. GSB1 TaxID=281093 RepID=UPI0012374C6D|nr:alginate lyase family protein [Prosthecochloris sp. GSB1]